MGNTTDRRPKGRSRRMLVWLGSIRERCLPSVNAARPNASGHTLVESLQLPPGMLAVSPVNPVGSIIHQPGLYQVEHNRRMQQSSRPIQCEAAGESMLVHV
jgi:hypothetical protein